MSSENKLLGHPLTPLLAIAGVVMLGGVAGYLLYQITIIQSQVADLEQKLGSTNTMLAEETSKLALYLGELDKKASGLESKTAGIQGTLSEAQKSLQNTKSELESTRTQVEGTAKTVGALEKLAATDPEVLQKYSKVYFLSENYAPNILVPVDTKYLYSEGRSESIEYRVLPHLARMLDDAAKANISLYVKSAFRSFNEQKVLKDAYTVNYGAGANTFSADQGYSEHQLGTTVDLITPGLGGQLYGFDSTPAYAWMLENAHTYGFILSYPKNNAHYIFEPWHWRYVGIPLATYLYDNKRDFYELDQRLIDSYLVSIFD